MEWDFRGNIADAKISLNYSYEMTVADVEMSQYTLLED